MFFILEKIIFFIRIHKIEETLELERRREIDLHNMRRTFHYPRCYKLDMETTRSLALHEHATVAV